MSGTFKWKTNLSDGLKKVLQPEKGVGARFRHMLLSLISFYVTKMRKFFTKTWNIGVAEPKKFIHCLKVGVALSIASLFYYMKPLHESVGGSAMCAILTVIAVFEYTVGATLCKSINRAIASVIAGSLGVGIHWIASHFAEQYEPIVLGTSVFIVAAAATFSRFIPFVKARFDYGVLSFILVFTFVSLSGYRVDNLVMLAEERACTIAIGGSLCILVNILVWPAWAGDQLHDQSISNLEKLANSLEGCIAQYFSSSRNANITEEGTSILPQEYKSVLNSQAAEESMENFAKWEPAHGHFHTGHPWKQYLMIGAAARKCAYCIDYLNSFIDSEMQAPEFVKKHIGEECIRLSSCSSEVLKELATMIRTKRRSSEVDFLVDELNLCAENLINVLKSFPYQTVLPLTVESKLEGNGEEIENPNKASIFDIWPLGTIVNLLIECVARIIEIVLAVDKLGKMAEFKKQEVKKSEDVRKSMELNRLNHEAMKALENV